VVQAKVRDSRKTTKRKRHDGLGAPMEEHSVPVYKWRFLPDFLLNMGFLPKKYLLPIKIANLCRALPRQWLDLSPMIPSPMKFAECLYCDVSPPPILLVLSVIYNHIVIQPYSYTFIQSYVHAYTIYTQPHSYMITFLDV